MTKRPTIFLEPSHHLPNTVTFLKKTVGWKCRFAVSVTADGVFAQGYREERTRPPSPRAATGKENKTKVL